MLPGAYDSDESRAAFMALLLELQASPHHVQTPQPSGRTMAELLLAYLDHAEKHYRTPDGKHTSEIYEVRVVIRALRELYADKPVTEFGPLCVKAARQRWVNEGLSRTECNRRVAMIKRIFKWAVSEELAPTAVDQAVATLAGLQKGRTAAREKEPVGLVDDAVVDATLPFLGRHVSGLVEFQRLTGCRQGEACAVRRCDIDTPGPNWLYKPPHHKTAHWGKSRTITIGPRAQALLREFFTPEITDYLFSPRRAVEEIRAEPAALRKTPCYPSHMARKAAKWVKAPRRRPAEKYNTQTYGLAIDRACGRAFPPPGAQAQRYDETHEEWRGRLTPAERDEVKAWRKAHHWHPNQLRHSFATWVRKEHGLEAAQVLLGHSRADVTQVYAERDEKLAATVAAKIG
jgi:integrase